MRKQVYDRTQPAVGEDEAPVNAPKWTMTGYNGSLKAVLVMGRDNVHGRDVQDCPVHGHELCNVQDMSRTLKFSLDIVPYQHCLKASVEKYTRQNFSKPLPPTALSTAPIKAGPSHTADIFYLDKSTLVGENVLDSDSSSEEADKEKKESGSSEDESDSSSSEESSSGDEEDDDKNKGKDKEEGNGASSSSSEEEADDCDKGKNVDYKNDKGDKEEDDKEDDKNKEEGVKNKEDDKVEDDKAENEEDKHHDKNEEAGDRVVEE